MRSTLLAVTTLAVAVTGCERDMRDMFDQPRLHPDSAEATFADGRATRPSPIGAVARPPQMAHFEPLARGRERYDIYCAPCHSPTGDGDGMVVRRGFPRPPSFHTPEQRALAPTGIDTAIRDGSGAMPAFGSRIDADDRAAIVAYVRALQLSRHATLDDVPSDERQRLESP